MKCPTCGYIGFETADRCRNCGYEFALAGPQTSAPDLSLKDGDTGGPLREIEMGVRGGARASASVASVGAASQPDLDRVLQNLDRVIGAVDGPGPDLPLFGADDPAADQAPLVSAGASPRRPLAVRRTTPDPARLRAKSARPRFDPAPQPSLELPPPEAAPAPSFRQASAPEHDATTGAPPLRRAAAALVDAAIIGAIDAIVVSFTLRLCGLESSDYRLLPVVPLLCFFALVNGGYLAAFTAAGGQTIGKMAFGLRVVAHADMPVSPGLSMLRAIGCLGSILVFGLGFVPALLSDGGRALEDRLADTRVIRIAA